MDADAAAAGERAARLLPGLGFPAGAVAAEPIPVEPEAVPGHESDAVPGHESDAVPGRQSEAVPGRQSEAVPGRGPGTVPGREGEVVPGRGSGTVPAREADAGSGRWFVPVVRGDDLLGFLDFAGATLLRSSFFRPAGPARDWLDRDHIRGVAERFSGQDATGPPVLSHDGPPDHLAWRVPMPSGAVFVAGASAWWARLRPDDVTG